MKNMEKRTTIDEFEYVKTEVITNDDLIELHIRETNSDNKITDIGFIDKKTIMSLLKAIVDYMDTWKN